MEQTLFKRLPKELNIETLLNLPFNEAKEKCELFGLCDDEKFWQRYVERHYYATVKKGKLNWFELADAFNAILEDLWERGLYPDSRIFQFFGIFGRNKDLKALDDANDALYTKNREFLGILDFADLMNDKDKLIKTLKEELLPKLPHPENPYDVDIQFDIAQIINIIYNYNAFEEKYAAYVMRQLDKPTLYLTPKGPIQIDFNKDVALLLQYEQNPITKPLNNTLESALDSMGLLLYLKTFR
jgi:hypothetical protein